MEKKKILKIEAAVLILGILFISSVNAKTINYEKTETDTGGIEYFVFCTIKGEYTEEIENNGNSVHIKSTTKSIKVTGIAEVYGCNPGIPNPAFRSIETDEIKTNNFDGFCLNGQIRGTGLGIVKIGDYESLVKTKFLLPRLSILVKRI